MATRAHAAESFSQLRHTLRTPLNHIIGYAEMLIEDAAGPQEAENRTALKMIVMEAQRVCDIIQGLGTTDDSDTNAEIVKLRADMLAHVRRIYHSTTVISGLNRTDVDRIRGAASELLGFAERGNLAPVTSELLVRTMARRPEAQTVPARLLVVDDDEGNRDILKRHLERQGHTVEQAASGQEALELLHRQPFEALLLDLVMPGMNGLEVLAAVKADGALENLPVLVISASDDLTAVAESIQGGAEDYLIKPFDPTLLNARLSATLERKRLRDRERSKNAELEHVTIELKRSNEDLQRFAYAASHDLQAPVRTITTYIQLLQRRLKDRLGDDEREMFAFAEGAAKRMHALIHDLLRYSQASTVEPRSESLVTNDLVDSLLIDMDSLIKESGASIERSDLPVVNFDASRLRQIFQNLIGNAIKYRATRAPKVGITAAAVHDSWRFCVQDNGQGIAPQHMDRIFEMFQRLHGEEVPGSGIGLSICKRLIERYGGRIWVDSEVDSGSSFYFTIPMARTKV